MPTVVTAVGLTAAYALLWRHAALKGRRLRAERARARRLARRYYGIGQIARPSNRPDARAVWADVRRHDVAPAPSWITYDLSDLPAVAAGESFVIRHDGGGLF